MFVCFVFFGGGGHILFKYNSLHSVYSYIMRCVNAATNQARVSNPNGIKLVSVQTVQFYTDNHKQAPLNLQ